MTDNASSSMNPIGRLAFRRDGSLKHTARATCAIAAETAKAIRAAAKRDAVELPTLQHVLNYCLKLGIETYLDGQQSEDVDSMPSVASATEKAKTP